MELLRGIVSCKGRIVRERMVEQGEPVGVAKLRAHRAALEAGADPAIVAGWMGEVQAQRIVAEARLRQGSGRQRMTAEEIRDRPQFG